MMETIKDANSIQHLQAQLKQGLPEDFEKYYARKLAAVELKHRSVVRYGLCCEIFPIEKLTRCSKILSCLVFSKRPLLLEELCEAVGACETISGQNISRDAPLFRTKVLELCAPLVEIQETDENSTVCLLSHAAVRTFLLKKPSILCHGIEHSEESAEDFTITPKTFANLCLKYLSQPCFKYPLEKKEQAFQTKDGRDINSFHLLTYVAKYWSTHLDNVNPEEGWCYHVANFLKSRQFLTMLQIQSLLVEGM
jgi:hypothetical protein